MKKLLVVFLCISAFGFAQNSNYQKLDELFDVLYQNNKIMGSIAILKDGNTVYNKSVGYQYIIEDRKKVATLHSKYRIASITKMFTATMIFQLIDEGKIKLENNLSIYFPKINNASKITIANMLNHSSGLFDVTRDENFNEQERTTEDLMVSRIATYDVIFQPGEKNEYSNTNFVLLGYILEKIENESYKEILKNRITNKLDLKNTYYGGIIDINANECLSYYYEDDTSLHEAKQADLSNPGGAGAIVSTPLDLVVFMDALFNNKLMSTQSFNKMTTITNEYGSGILSAEKGGKTIFAHNGSIDRFKSMLVYIPELKTSIAINANALDYGIMPIIFNIMDVVEGKEIAIPNFDGIELSENELRQYEGVYECAELPFNLVFEAHGKTLKGAPEGNDLKVLRSTKKNEFALDALGVILTFNIEEHSVLVTSPGEGTNKFTKKL